MEQTGLADGSAVLKEKIHLTMKTWNSSQHQWKSNMVAQHKPKIHWFHIYMLKNDGRKELSLCFPLHWTITFLKGKNTVTHTFCGYISEPVSGWGRAWAVRSSVFRPNRWSCACTFRNTSDPLIWFWIHFFVVHSETFYCCQVLLESHTLPTPPGYFATTNMHFPGWALVVYFRVPRPLWTPSALEY